MNTPAQRAGQCTGQQHTSKNTRRAALLMIATMAMHGCRPPVSIPSALEVLLPAEQAPAANDTSNGTEDFDAAEALASLKALMDVSSSGLSVNAAHSPPAEEPIEGASAQDVPQDTVPGTALPATIDGYQEFLAYFRAKTQKDWTTWKHEVLKVGEQLDEARQRGVEVPDASKLQAKLKQLAEHRSRYDDHQLSLLEDCLRLLDEYVGNDERDGCLDLVEASVKAVDQALLALRQRTQNAIDEVEAMKDKQKFDSKQAVQQHLTAMMSSNGSVGGALAHVRDHGDVYKRGIETVDHAARQASRKREELNDKIDELLSVVPDPELRDVVEEFQEQDEKFWSNTRIVLSAICPALLLLFLLMQLFGGGGGGNGDGEGDGDGKQDGQPDGSTGQQPSESTGGTKDNRSDERYPLPRGAKPVEMKTSLKGSHVVRVFVDSNGKQWVRVFVEGAEDKSQTLPFEIRTASDFAPFAAEFEQLTLTGLEAAATPPLTPITLEFSLAGTPKWHVRWQFADTPPALLETGEASPIPLKDLQAVPLPPSAAKEGHSWRVGADSDGKHWLLLAIDGDGGQTLRLPFDLDDEVFQQAIDNHLLTIEAFLELGGLAKPLPIKIRCGGFVDGQPRHIRWEEGQPPRFSEN